MIPRYCVFSPSGTATVAAVQSVVPGEQVNLIRTNANLNMRGVQSFNFSSFNRPITFTLNNALTGIGTLTVKGKNSELGALTETITTLNSGLNTLANTYADIDYVQFDLLPNQTLTPNTTISIGTGATGEAVIGLDTMVYMQQVNIAANITSGTMTYTVSQTLDNCFFPVTEPINAVASGTQFWEALPSMTTETDSKIADAGDIKIPISGLQIIVSASTGGATFTILQQGGAFI